MTTAEYEDRLLALVGQPLVAGRVAPDPVNEAMIHHWVSAMGDRNPIYHDVDAARATGRESIVAPPTMLQVWGMRTYEEFRAPTSASGDGVAAQLQALLAEGGYTSVVATNCEQEYRRELVPGDRVEMSTELTHISAEKSTGLGVGRFVTSTRTYRDQHGEIVATQLWRELRFRPSNQNSAEAPSQRPLRPRPAINRDNAFWFDAAREHRLVIQRCAQCEALRHPPGPACPQCNSFDWNTIEASGRGEVYSFTVAHHPRLDAFDYPLPIAVVALAEGTRLIANLVDLAPEDVFIGMPVALTWIDADLDLSLPAFRPEGA